MHFYYLLHSTYDQSGEVYKVDVDDLEVYISGPFMNANCLLDNLYTGDMYATHLSGHGWGYITFGDCIRDRLADELINEVYSLNQELCWWLDKEEDKKTCIIEIIENWDEWCSYLFEPTMKYTENRLKDLWKI